MIAFLTIVYSLLYIVLFNKLKLIPKTNGTIATFIGGGVVMLGAIIFSWYSFSPVSPDARLHRQIIPIVPNVRGLIQEVTVEAYQPKQKGDMLFRIDPKPYKFKVAQARASIAQFQAQQALAKIQVERAQRLLKTQAAAQVDLDRWRAEMDMADAAIASAEAQLDNAEWELAETTVRAPSEGYAVNVAIRPGTFAGTVGMASTLPFVSTDDSQLIASYSQSSIRNIRVGDEAEFTFALRPGQVYGGEVSHVIGLSASAQTTASGLLPATGIGPADRWVVRIKFDDQELARSLPQGTAGTATVYTQRGKPVHIISKVAIRMNAWLAYLTNP